MYIIARARASEIQLDWEDLPVAFRLIRKRERRYYWIVNWTAKRSERCPSAKRSECFGGTVRKSRGWKFNERWNCNSKFHLCWLACLSATSFSKLRYRENKGYFVWKMTFNKIVQPWTRTVLLVIIVLSNSKSRWHPPVDWTASPFSITSHDHDESSRLNVSLLRWFGGSTAAWCLWEQLTQL